MEILVVLLVLAVLLLAWVLFDRTAALKRRLDGVEESLGEVRRRAAGGDELTSRLDTEARRITDAEQAARDRAERFEQRLATLEDALAEQGRGMQRAAEDLQSLARDLDQGVGEAGRRMRHARQQVLGLLRLLVEAQWLGSRGDEGPPSDADAERMQELVRDAERQWNDVRAALEEGGWTR